MSAQTYKYFTPDNTLRAVYGGGAILDGGDSAEIPADTLTERYIHQQLGYPKDGTRRLFDIDTVSGAPWFKVSDNLYPAIAPYLSAAELATVTSTAPAGLIKSSRAMVMQPHPTKQNVFVRGDSISDAQGVIGNDKRLIYAALAIEDIEGEALDMASTSRVGETSNYCLINYSLGSSSWGNTNPAKLHAYPQREDLAYNQRTKTIPMNEGDIFIYWLTNDIPYDPAVTGAVNWARAQARISQLAADFPTIKIIIGTGIKRTEGVEQNNRIHDYNTLLRANYLSAGAHVLMDFEAEVPEVNITTGDTANSSIYTDSVHLTALGHTKLMPVCKTAILEAKGL